MYKNLILLKKPKNLKEREEYYYEAYSGHFKKKT